MRILSMSGLVPEHICDTIRFDQYTGDRNISHFCGYASDFISQVRQDKDIDGAVFPRSCDSTRTIESYLEGCGKFVYRLEVPVYGTEGAVDYYAKSIRNYKDAVESHYGVTIDYVAERTQIINKRNESIRRIYSDISNVSYSEYIKTIHQMLKRPLAEQGVVDGISSRRATDRKVFIVGSFLPDTGIASIIEEAGLTVVGDSLPESGRLATMPDVSTDGDIYRNIAESMLSMRPSPTLDAFGEAIRRDGEEIRKKGVKGVIFITQKYCEAYDYLYAAYRQATDLPSIQIKLNDTEDSRKAALSIEAFADIL